MHPVEAFLYYTAAALPCLWGGHPILAVTAIIDLGIAAWLSHDGFQWPGNGSYFHMLHHKHFDCNFGSQYLPLDWAFGTFASCQEDVKKIWKRPDIGRDGNEGVVHASSLSKLAVS